MNIESQRKELQYDEGGHAQWVNVLASHDLDPAETAVLICDMWDKHWSRGATERVNALAPRINEFVIACRRNGMTIIHAPSETLDVYEIAPARRRAEEIPLIQPPIFTLPAYPPLPIDDSDGGSDTNQDGTEIPNNPVWTRQHPVIEIDDDVDYITDIGYEVYSLLTQKGFKHVLIAGVHTNMCVLGRSFAIKQMVGWNIDVMLVRDLTDAMYNPARSPYVNHDEGTRLVIEYIEKFLCPTVKSVDFLE
ncbi:MAG TPA: isochorismatase [Candidatus Lokiarchaeia archaeon]|nr:isochorismatase [Candidatus Lokiarchaeia archaeon]